MSGILPNVEDGAVVVRDAAGNCLDPIEVVNAYCPPTTFQTSCTLTALPDDCTARITPAQVNAIVSEMLCLGVALSPNATGAWDCDSTCNLATLFSDWVTANTPHGDGVTIEGDGSPSNLFRIIPAGVVAAICDDDDVRAALAACLISEEPNNLITLGVDGRLLANIVTSGGIIVGAGTADFPLSIDITEAQSQLGILPNPYRETLGTTNITILDRGAAVNFLASGDAIFDDAADLEDTFNTQIWASDNASVTLVPEAGQTINGLTSLIVPPGRRADVWSDGANLHAKITADAQPLPGYVSGLFPTTNSADRINDVNISAGSAASDVTPYTVLSLTSTMVKRIDAAWAAGTNNGGLDTGAVGNGTYYIWLIQRSDNLATDILFSLSNTTPVMPVNYDRKRLIGELTRVAGANGPPQFTAAAYGIRRGQVVALSGVSTDIIGIPVGTKRITLDVRDAVSSAGSGIFLQPIDETGVVSAGYNGITTGTTGTGSSTGSSPTTFFTLTNSGTTAFDGEVVLTRITGGWRAHSWGKRSSNGEARCIGFIPAGEITGFRILSSTTATLTGTVEPLWEF